MFLMFLKFLFVAACWPFAGRLLVKLLVALLAVVLVKPPIFDGNYRVLVGRFDGQISESDQKAKRSANFAFRQAQGIGQGLSTSNQLPRRKLNNLLPNKLSMRFVAGSQ